ncbi:MAG TPA: phosphoribosylanthranilate isomerase [Acidimicrobiia bacterium]|nr:phosphoribosylanthranilate isomerase [Acidimicrobiia bacterium]
MFVKICGLTTEEDALLALALGADALGFVFAPGSPRQVSVRAVQDIVHRLPPGTTTVGVFRDERRERVVEVVHTIGLTGAQLHGREHPTEVRWVADRVPLVLQAFPAGDPALAQAAGGGASAVLIDAPEPGSGRVYDWSLAEGAPPGVRVVLAGGLDEHNVGDAIRAVRPFGVDVSTGVETEPGSGRKDPLKLRRFIEAAREAGAAVAEDEGMPAVEPGRLYDWSLERRD